MDENLKYLLLMEKREKVKNDLRTHFSQWDIVSEDKKYDNLKYHEFLVFNFSFKYFFISTIFLVSLFLIQAYFGFTKESVSNMMSDLWWLPLISPIAESVLSNLAGFLDVVNNSLFRILIYPAILIINCFLPLLFVSIYFELSQATRRKILCYYLKKNPKIKYQHFQESRHFYKEKIIYMKKRKEFLKLSYELRKKSDNIDVQSFLTHFVSKHIKGEVPNCAELILFDYKHFFSKKQLKTITEKNLKQEFLLKRKITNENDF